MFNFARGFYYAVLMSITLPVTPERTARVKLYIATYYPQLLRKDDYAE